MAISEQEATAQRARRIVSRYSAAAKELGMHGGFTLDVEYAPPGAWRAKMVHTGVSPKAAIAVIDRAAERHAEAGTSVAFTIIPHFPSTHIDPEDN